MSNDAPAGLARGGQLRIGLLIDSICQPRWVHKVISDIQRSDFARIAVIVKCRSAERNSTGWLRNAYRNKTYWLYDAHEWLDDRLGRNSSDAFEPLNVAEAVPECPMIELDAFSGIHGDGESDIDSDSIRSFDLDVALAFGNRDDSGPVPDIARFGVWAYDDGRQGCRAGFWEVMKSAPVSRSVLRRLADDHSDSQVLYRSFASNLSKSVRRNRNSQAWKSSAFAIRKLKSLHEDGLSALDVEVVTELGANSNDFNRGKPGNLRMFGLLARLGWRYLRQRVARFLYSEQWRLGFSFSQSEGHPGPATEGFTQLVPPAGLFWADPFPVVRDDRYFVFFEEYVRANGKGHISAIELNRDGRAGQALKVLEMDYHLSYPHVFDWQGETYMLPETRANRTIELYRCIEFPDRWELATVLMSDVNAVDATLEVIDGRWWMFVNMATEGASMQDELHVYFAESPLGPWTPHRRNPVKSDVRSARPAGRLFRRDGDLYRPSQDCSERYGYAIAINRVDRIDADRYEEVETTKILPKRADRVLATHTLNVCGDLTVADRLVRTAKYGFGQRDAA